MTLTDTGPLVALSDRNDPEHARCVQAAAALPSGPMLTTWSCLTEAMYLLGRTRDPRGRAQLWRMLVAGTLRMHPTDDRELVRIQALMRIYANVPMDFADASVVSAAEVLSLRTVFALDNHFRIYRLADGSFLTVIP